mgnify:CR=1 FL=1
MGPWSDSLGLDVGWLLTTQKCTLRDVFCNMSARESLFALKIGQPGVLFSRTVVFLIAYFVAIFVSASSNMHRAAV